MFRNLIPALADRYHVIAPDYPGYGNSSAPAAAVDRLGPDRPHLSRRRCAPLQARSEKLGVPPAQHGTLCTRRRRRGHHPPDPRFSRPETRSGLRRKIVEISSELYRSPSLVNPELGDLLFYSRPALGSIALLDPVLL